MSEANILVVDDNPVIVTYLSAILTKSGYEVFSAVNGREGQETVDRESIDLIISDKNMPEVDGIQFCKSIKEGSKTKDIYFILLSITDTSESKAEGLNIGADDYLSKTITSEELLARVKAGLRIKNLVNQLKNANLSLFQAEKLASIGQLAAGVAHEINNPVGFITSNLRTLGDYVGDLLQYISVQEKIIKHESLGNQEDLANLRQELDIDYIADDIQNLVGESLDGSDRVKKIILDLKNFARTEKGGKQKSSLEVMINSTLNIIWNELKYKAKIIREFADEELVIFCNSQEINQVLMNLLLNASQSIEGQGEITIKTWQDEKFVNIAISDTGCGIPEENMSKLFEPFFTTKAVGKGTGLGLSIIYDIVKKHGGKVLVDSTVGAGTTFTVQLPGNGENLS